MKSGNPQGFNLSVCLQGSSLLHTHLFSFFFSLLPLAWEAMLHTSCCPMWGQPPASLIAHVLIMEGVMENGCLAVGPQWVHIKMCAIARCCTLQIPQSRQWTQHLPYIYPSAILFIYFLLSSLSPTAHMFPSAWQTSTSKLDVSHTISMPHIQGKSKGLFLVFLLAD